MSEPNWTYVTPADGPNRVLHLPGCRMMKETERLGRSQTVDYLEGRDPMSLGDRLCKHCQKRVDPLPKIRAFVAEFPTVYPRDREAHEHFGWLIAEVERLRKVPLL